MDDEEVNPLGSPTTNYGWTKPTVGGDLDVWGGYLNTDLDGIDSTVFALSTNFSATAPAMDGTAAAGVATTFARSDHVHPTDASRYAASNPAGYVTSAGAASAAPVQSFNTRTGAIALLSGDVTGALGFTPYSNANPANYITAAGAPVQSFNTRTGAVSLTLADVTGVGGAPLASPAFTGTPSLPTGTTGITQVSTDSSTKLATTAFVGAAVTAGAYTLPQATTTVLGGVKVDGTTITAASGVISAAASTPTNPNKLDNGDMSVNQRAYAVGSGIAFTLSNAFMLDRWSFFGTKVTKWNWGINYPYSPPPGFQYCQGCQVLTSAATASGDQNYFQQAIEIDNIVDAQWGTAGAQPMTLSFWAISTATGGFSLSIASTGATWRVYITTFNISTPNTWQYFTKTIPPDSNAIWAASGGLSVVFDLGSGTSYNSATLGWQSTTTAFKYSSGLNITSTIGAKFAFTGVKLELGSAATPFVFDHPQVKLARCQRYYQINGNTLFSGNVTSGSTYYVASSFAVTLRGAPLVVPYYGNAVGFPAAAPTVGAPTTLGFQVSNTANATGAGFYQFGWAASAEI